MEKRNRWTVTISLLAALAISGCAAFSVAVSPDPDPTPEVAPGRAETTRCRGIDKSLVVLTKLKCDKPSRPESPWPGYVIPEELHVGNKTLVVFVNKSGEKVRIVFDDDLFEEANEFTLTDDAEVVRTLKDSVLNTPHDTCVQRRYDFTVSNVDETDTGYRSLPKPVVIIP